MIAGLVFAGLLLIQTSPEMRQHVEAGLKAKNAGDLETAAREFQRVVDLAPSLPAAHVNLGAVYFAKKDYGKAIPPLKRAMELNPDLPGAASMLGSSLLAQGYASEAIPYLEKSGSDDLVGVALLEAGREREAVDRLEAALEKRPNDPDLMYYLGQAQGKLARRILERLQATAPDSARARQLAGEASSAAGNRAAAEQHFRAALAARPDLRGVHLSLGELALAGADYAAAEKEFRAEVEMAPGSAVAHYKLGLALLQQGNVNGAVAELETADKLQPAMPETMLELGKALLTAGKPKQAEPLLAEVVKLEGESGLAESAYYQLAQAYRQLGRAADAEQATRAFQKLRSKRKQ